MAFKSTASNKTEIVVIMRTEEKKILTRLNKKKTYTCHLFLNSHQAAQEVPNSTLSLLYPTLFHLFIYLFI